MFPWKGQPAAEPQHENTTIIEVNNQLSTWCHFLSRIEHTIRKTYTSTWVHQAVEKQQWCKHWLTRVCETDFGNTKGWMHYWLPKAKRSS